MSIRIGIIGGSGLYDMAELTDREERTIRTPFGEPSAPYVIGTLRGQRVAFLARHGRGHRLTPSELNYRANIFGFKTLGFGTLRFLASLPISFLFRLACLKSGGLFLFRLDRIVLDQARDRFGRLSSNADPILDALVLQTDFSGIRHGIVSTEILDVRAVALGTLFLHHQAVERLTLRAHSH